MRGEYSLANATSEAGYLSGFYGKWHLGSLRNETSDCYTPDVAGKCLPGYVNTGLSCCQGLDGKLQLSNPLNFGFDEFVATPQCGAGGTTNCGCFFQPTPHNDSQCVVGHYKDSCSTCNQHLECAQYFHGHDGVIDQWPGVSGADDEDFLVDRFENLMERAVAADKPFMAILFFHGVHIPYVATPESRALYPNATENEQDYWGGLTQIDKAVGRVRSLLRSKGIEDDTWVSITADNGPEVSPASGQGTGGAFINPGRTGGLRGRKRDVSEGGIREIGLVEYPAVVKQNREEFTYPMATMDLLPTVLDMIGQKPFEGRALDGASLLPFLAGNETQRPQSAGLGWHGVFSFGETNHVNGTFPHLCPNVSDSETLGDIPDKFSTPGNQRQWAWAEGNDLKLLGCQNKADHKWHFFMYNLTADFAEEHDLWKDERDTAKAMYARFATWQESVLYSQGENEIGCKL